MAFLDENGLSELWHLMTVRTDPHAFANVVTGSFTIAKEGIAVNLGFRPRLVIVYMKENNLVYEQGTIGTSPDRRAAPVILSDAVMASDGYTYLLDDGFNFCSQGAGNTNTYTYYYIAFK